jgi:Glyoxalase-like domain
MNNVIGWIGEVVMDCVEPWQLARFWADLLGGTPVEWYPGWVTLEPPPQGQGLSFQATTAVPDRDAARVHFDVLVDDLAAAGDRVVAAGAVFVREHVSPRPGPGGEAVTHSRGRCLRQLVAAVPGPGRSVMTWPALAAERAWHTEVMSSRPSSPRRKARKVAGQVLALARAGRAGRGPAEPAPHQQRDGRAFGAGHAGACSPSARPRLRYAVARASVAAQSLHSASCPANASQAGHCAGGSR